MRQGTARRKAGLERQYPRLSRSRPRLLINEILRRKTVEDREDREAIWYFISRIGGTALFLTVALLAGCPQYAVYKARLEGEAIHKKADGARQALVAQAQAELDAAQKRADAIKILGQSAKDYPEYRQQEFIGAFAHALHEGKIAQLIYVPTEGMMPIMEAGRVIKK